MIIGQVDIVRVAFLESKHDSPVAGHRNGPEAFKLAFKPVKPEAWKAHVLNVGRLVQPRQDALDLVYVRKPAVVVVFVEPSQTPVLKRLDHSTDDSLTSDGCQQKGPHTAYLR